MLNLHPANLRIAILGLGLALAGCNESQSAPAPGGAPLSRTQPWVDKSPEQHEPAAPPATRLGTVPPKTPEAPNAPAGKPLSIRVMTYNLGLLKIVNPNTPEDPTNMRGKSDVVPLVAERAAAVPELLAAYAARNHVDVLGLEEAWLKPHAERIAAALKQAGYTVFVPEARPPEPRILNAFFEVLSAGKSDDLSADIDAMASLPLPSVRILGSGLLLAVGPGLKMNHPEFHAFRETGGFEKFTTKGMITAEIEQTGAASPNRFVAALAHLQALATYKGRPYIDSESNAFKSQQDQARAIIQHEMDSLHESAILFGDMNTGIDYLEPEFDRFSSEFGYRNAYYEAIPMSKDVSWSQTNPLVKNGEMSEEHSSLIDHVFLIDRAAAAGEGPAKWKALEARISFSSNVVSQKSHQELPASVPLSDHYAVEAVIGLSEP